MVNRKKFIQLASMSVSTLMVPRLVSGTLADLTGSPPYQEMASGAFNAARAKGASYADVRFGPFAAVSQGLSVRVLVDGSWGHAATSMLSGQEIDHCVSKAVASAIAAKNSVGKPQRHVYDPKGKYDWWRAETFR